MADIHEDITGDSSSLVEALQDAFDAAEPLAEALKQIRSALAELEGASEGLEETSGELSSARDEAAQAAETVDDLQAAFDALAASGPDLSDLAAFLEEDAEAAGSFRDRALEAAQAEMEVVTSAAGLGDAAVPLEEDAAAAGHYRDNLAEAKIEAGSFRQVMADLAGELIMNNPGDMFVVQMNQLGKMSVRPLQEALGASITELAQSLEPGGGLDLAGQMLAAGQAAGTWEKALDGLGEAVEAATPFIESQAGVIDDLGDAGAGFVQNVRDEVAAMQAFSAAWHAFDASGKWDDLQRLGQASADLDSKLGAASGAGEDFTQAFGDVESAGQDVAVALGDAALGLQDVEEAAGDAGQGLQDAAGSLAGLAGFFGSQIKDVAGDVPLLGAAIAALIPLALGAATGIAAVGAGFVSFGAMALPALDKVVSGLSAVNQAQAAYNQARAVQARDPTKDNLADEQKDLAALRAAWAAMPAPVSAAVQAVQQFQHTWTQASRQSGIQNDALRDIRLILGDAQDAIPVVEELAQAFAPIVSGGLSDLGKNLDSKDFKDFTASLAKDAPPAATAMHELAGGVSDYLSGLQEKGAEPANQLASAIARLMKQTAPDAVTGTVNSIHALTSAINGLDTVAKSPVLDTLAKTLGVLFDAGTKTWNFGTGGLKQEIQYLHDWFNLTATHPKPVVIPPVNTSELRKSLSPASLPPFVLTPHVDTSALRRSLSADSGLLDGALTVRPKVDVRALQQSLSADSGLAGGAKVDVKADTSHMQQQVSEAAKNVKIAGVEVDLSNAKLSGLAALQPVLTAAGKDAGQDFVRAVTSAITSGDAHAVAAARAVATGVRGAFSGLRGQMQAIGTNADQGLAAGITADQGTAVAAAHALAAAVESAARVRLQTQSPSKVFEDIGKETVAGFVLGLEGGKNQVSAAIAAMLSPAAAPYSNAQISAEITKMRDEIEAAAKAGVISSSQESAYSKWLTADNTRLTALAEKRRNLENEISAADALASSVASAQVAATTVTAAYGMTYAGQAGTTAEYPTMKAALQAQLQQTREFGADIAKLKKEGLGSASIQALLAAGVSGGLPVATQLLSGGKAGVAQINELENELAKASKALGVTGANASYESGAEIAKGLAAGLKSQLKTVDNEMKKVADELVAALKKALRISSPSQATMEIGGQVVDGLVQGIEARRAAVSAAAAHLATSAITGPMAMAGAGGYGSSAGGGGEVSVTPLHVHVTVQTDGKTTARVVQKFQLQHARRNTKTGLQLQGRGI